MQSNPGQTVNVNSPSIMYKRLTTFSEHAFSEYAKLIIRTNVYRITDGAKIIASLYFVFIAFLIINLYNILELLIFNFPNLLIL